VNRRDFLKGGVVGTGLVTYPSLEDEVLGSFVDTLGRDVEIETRRAGQDRISMHDFVREFWPVVEPVTPFKDNWHIGCMCEHLDAVSMGQIKNLVFNVPPGCMKSLTVSVMFPAKEWTHNPEYRYLAGTYADELSMRDLMKMRDIVKSQQYQERWPLPFRSDQDTKHKIENVKTGWRIASTIGGGLSTGEHPHRKLIDDPHNVLQSLSKEKRAAAVDWFTLAMGARGLALDPATILTMQRLHEEDLSGYIRDKLGDRFVFVVLPMRYEPPAWVEVDGKKALKPRMERTPIKTPVYPNGFQDPRTRPGQLLWPELFPKDKVAGAEHLLRSKHGEFAVAGQMQQRPVPKTGGLIKREWFDVVAGIPKDEVIIARVRGWDSAATEGDGDWTVGVKLALAKSGYVYVEHVLRGQWGPETFEGPNGIFMQTVVSDGRDVRQREEQEPGSAGKKIIKAHSLMLPGYDFKGERATGDKETRNRPFRAFAAHRNVRIVAGPWNQEYLDVLCDFPNGNTDDDVDATSTAYNDLVLGPSPMKPLSINIG
jgi:predicted phage terminase large subunit-like protein